MPDKNLTDNEIFKALEDWIKNYDGSYVNFKTLGNALDLINRQKEEIERLKSRKAVIRKDLRCDSVDDILNGTFSIESENYVVCDVEEIKSEARKEFAERVKKMLQSEASFSSMAKSIICEGLMGDVDNLLIETESEKDA